jgi:formylglycine-generating enzyme required for sulfatase activity
LLAGLLAVAAFSAGAVGQQEAQPRRAAVTFKDCAECPEMVVVPPGDFLMGSPASGSRDSRDNDETPQHRVTIPQTLAVGKFEVTREEYGQFLQESGRPDGESCRVLGIDAAYTDTPGRSWRNPGFAQTPRDPAVCISWADAQAYVDWLRQKTGLPYRLLSESEWEYAARAGTSTTRFGGDEPAQLCVFANGGDLDYSSSHPLDRSPNKTCRDGYSYTSPGGSFLANAFGLHDMLGNVWEWTADCWNENYNRAPTDGRAWTNGECAQRVMRGGSWSLGPRVLRSASRSGATISFRVNNRGFRIARTY